MVLSEEQLKDIMDRLLKNINEGLSKENHDSAAVKCYVTYVQDLPSGKGKFFRLDFAINLLSSEPVDFYLPQIFVLK